MSPGGVERTAALALLGLGVRADRAAIVGAYHRLARLTHPDACGEPGAQERFVALNHAYRTALTALPSAQVGERPPAPQTPRAGPVPRTQHRPVRADDLLAGPVDYRPWQPGGGAVRNGGMRWS